MLPLDRITTILYNDFVSNYFEIKVDYSIIVCYSNNGIVCVSK